MSRFARTLRHGLRPGFRTGARCLRQNRQSSGNRAVRRDFPLHCSSPRPRTGFVRTSSDHVRRTGALGRLALDHTRDTDPVETRNGSTRSTACSRSRARSAAHFLLEQLIGRRAPPGRAGAVLGQHALPQHHPARPAGAASGRPRRSSTASARYDPLERARDRPAGQQGEPRSSAATSRASSPRPRSTTSASSTSGTRRPRPRRRPDLHPGPLLARHLRPRLPRGPAHRGAAAELPPGGRRQGHLAPTRIPG